eukprot:s397_g35.t1
MQTDAPMLLIGCFRGSATFVLDFLHSGMLLLLRSSSHLGLCVPVVSACRLGVSPFVVDWAVLGASFPMRSFAKLGLSLTVSDSARMALTPFPRSSGRPGSSAFLVRVCHFGPPSPTLDVSNPEASPPLKALTCPATPSFSCALSNAALAPFALDLASLGTSAPLRSSSRLGPPAVAPDVSQFSSPLPLRSFLRTGSSPLVPDSLNSELVLLVRSSAQPEVFALALGSSRLGFSSMLRSLARPSPLLIALDSCSVGFLLSAKGFAKSEVASLTLDLAMPESSPFMRSRSRLGPQTLLLDFLHLDMPMPPRALSRPEAFLLAHGVMRFEPPLLLLEAVHLESILSSRSPAQAETFLSVLASGHLGSSLVSRNSACAGFAAASSGHGRSDSSMLAVDFLHLGLSLSSKRLARIGMFMSSFSRARTGSISSALDPACMDLPALLRSPSCLGGCLSVSDLVLLGAPFLVQTPARSEAALSVLDFVHVASTPPSRSLSHAGTAAFAPDASYLDSLASLRSSSRFDFLVPVASWSHPGFLLPPQSSSPIGPAMPASDFLHPEASLLLRSTSCPGIPLMTLNFQHSGFVLLLQTPRTDFAPPSTACASLGLLLFAPDLATSGLSMASHSFGWLALLLPILDLSRLDSFLSSRRPGSSDSPSLLVSLARLELSMTALDSSWPGSILTAQSVLRLEFAMMPPGAARLGLPLSVPDSVCCDLSALMHALARPDVFPSVSGRARMELLLTALDLLHLETLLLFKSSACVNSLTSVLDSLHPGLLLPLRSVSCSGPCTPTSGSSQLEASLPIFDFGTLESFMPPKTCTRLGVHSLLCGFGRLGSPSSALGFASPGAVLAARSSSRADFAASVPDPAMVDVLLALRGTACPGSPPSSYGFSQPGLTSPACDLADSGSPTVLQNWHRVGAVAPTPDFLLLESSAPVRASACPGAVVLTTEFPRSEPSASLRSSACSETLTLVSGMVRTGASTSLVDYAVPGGELPVRHFSRSGSRLLVDCHRNSGSLPPSRSRAQFGPPTTTSGTACSDPLLLVIDHAGSDPSTSLQSSACSEATSPVASAQLDFPLLAPDWVNCEASSLLHSLHLCAFLPLQSFAYLGFPAFIPGLGRPDEPLAVPDPAAVGLLLLSQTFTHTGACPSPFSCSRLEAAASLSDFDAVDTSLLTRQLAQLGPVFPAVGVAWVGSLLFVLGMFAPGSSSLPRSSSCHDLLTLTLDSACVDTVVPLRSPACLGAVMSALDSIQVGLVMVIRSLFQMEAVSPVMDAAGLDFVILPRSISRPGASLLISDTSGIGAPLLLQGLAHPDMLILSAGTLRSGSLLPACDLAFPGLGLLLRSSSWLGLSVSVVSAHLPGSFPPPRTFFCAGSFVPPVGVACLGLPLPALAGATLGALLPPRSFVQPAAQPGLAFPVLALANMDSLPLSKALPGARTRSDKLCESDVDQRSFRSQLGTLPSSCGSARAEPPLLALDLLELDSSSSSQKPPTSPRALACLGLQMVPQSMAHPGFTSAVLDLSSLDLPVSSQRACCPGPPTTASGKNMFGSSPVASDSTSLESFLPMKRSSCLSSALLASGSCPLGSTMPALSHSLSGFLLLLHSFSRRELARKVNKKLPGLLLLPKQFACTGPLLTPCGNARVGSGPTVPDLVGVGAVLLARSCSRSDLSLPVSGCACLDVSLLACDFGAPGTPLLARSLACLCAALPTNGSS